MNSFRHAAATLVLLFISFTLFSQNKPPESKKQEPPPAQKDKKGEAKPQPAKSAEEEKKGTLTADTLSGLQFRLIGPAAASGRVIAFAVNHKNKVEYYVGVASGGVWKTPSPSGGSSTPLFRVMFSMLVMVSGPRVCFQTGALEP